MRFSSNGKKLRTRTWWNMMTWCSSVRYKRLTRASQLKSHECPTSLLLWWCTLTTSFSLATMCVTWREIGLATLQMTLTSKGVVQLKLSMKKPTWCSTVYERDFSDDPMVEVSWKGITSFSIRSDTEQQPVRLQSHETIQVQHGSAPHEGAMVWYKKSRPV